MNDTIGIFYEMPDGRIAKTYGWNGCAQLIHYYTEDGEPGSVTEEKWATWTPRRDLQSFDQSRDPALPSIFDLLWNLKKWSDLLRTINSGHESIEMIRDAMLSHGITEEKLKEKIKN